MGRTVANADPHSYSASGPVLLQEWRSNWLRRCSPVSGAVLLATTSVHALMTGAPLLGFGWLAGIAVALIAVPSLNASSSVQRTLFVTLLSVLLGLLGINLGWAPGNVAVSAFVVSAAGLLLGRRVGYAIVALQAGALWYGGRAIASGAFAIDSATLDATILANWLRVAIVYGLLGVALWTLLRSAASLVSDAYAQTRVSLLLAERQLEAARQLRRARLERERGLRRVQKLQALGQLAGGLAHLMNNELTVVQGALHDLEHDPSLRTRQDVAARIEACIARAGATIRQLLVFGRRDEAAAQDLDLAAEVTRIVAELRPTISSDIQLDTRSATGCVVRIEPMRLRLVMLNLLLNASDALPSGGRVRITVRSEAPATTGTPSVALVIEDTGEGMDREVLGRACDTFFSTRGRREHGGLGLSIAAGIVEQAGGRLSIESARDVGTRVRLVWLQPVQAPQPQPESYPLLHPDELTPADEPRLDPGANTDEAATGDGDQWKRETTVRLSRIGALFLLPVLFAAKILSPRVPLLFFVIVGTAVLATATGGWSTRISHTWRLTLLFVPMTIAVSLTLGMFSFNAPGVIAVMALLTGWAALLGPRWVGLAVHAYFVATFGVVGWLMHAHRLEWDEQLTTMANPTNWVRVAVSLTAVEVAMLASLRLIVGHAIRGIATMNAARSRAERAGKEEESECKRAVTFEREAAHIERLSVSGTAAGSLAHDLNNALQALALASWLAGPDVSDEDIRNLTRDLKLTAKHCAALVGLAAEAPELRAQRLVAIDVSAGLARVKDLLPFFVGSGVAVDVDTEPSCWAAIADSDLQRVLLNLAANARDAMKGSGRLYISLRREAGYVVLRVRDTGSGMDEATRARLFEPFFTTKPVGEGTGLGLHTIQGIMTETHGIVTCDSQVGVGTTFTLRWPCVEQKAPVDRVAMTCTEPGIQGRVLVADDQALVRQTIARVLRSAGYDVHEAGDGDGALRLIEDGKPWAAMCIDGVMPGRASTEVIDAFLARNPQSPVLLCSGHLPQELERRRLSSAPVTVLAKPFSPDDLQRTLGAAMRSRSTVA